MKDIILLFAIATLCSCTKKDNNSGKIKAGTASEIDSINAARTKYNDSITVLNAKNHFADLSGDHQFTHSSISNKGNVTFTNIGRDRYTVSGGAKAGKDYVEIEGEIKMVSEEFLNFTGKITQSIQQNDHGKIDVRTKKTSFAKKGNARFWRVQNRVNSSGFTDNIDIFK